MRNDERITRPETVYEHADRSPGHTTSTAGGLDVLRPERREPEETEYCPVCCEPVHGGMTTETGASVHTRCMMELTLP